jgi:thiamine biosynthesis lipoprotein
MVTRRRAIAIFAAAAGLPLVQSRASAKAVTTPVVWKGQALGAPATLILNDYDREHASRLIASVVAEVERLEGIFSLYRESSAVCELNRVGGLAAPQPDMLALLDKCVGFWKDTDGLFDPTVQPIWELYRDHFAREVADEKGPEAGLLTTRLRSVGFEYLRHGSGRVAFARPGMAITLNGVAQGFITDRVVEMLRNEGVKSSLVDMGEERAIGAQADGTPWRVGLAASESDPDPDAVISVVNLAVATSSPFGFVFDRAGYFGHILHPRTGAGPMLYRRLSVVADSAATADALATAFNLMDLDSIGDVLKKYPDVSVDLVDLDGGHRQLGKAL